MGSRRQAREFSLQVLYQLDFVTMPLNDLFDQFWKDREASEEVRGFAHKLVEGTLRNLVELDYLIEGYSTNWKLSRMASVDRNLLRLSTFEILYLEDIPHSVTINEAVEIAKQYGTEESAAFINGILDKVAKEKKTM